MNKYKVSTIAGMVEFTGKYRRDLETNNWHYYEKEDGVVIHFRKEHIVWVDGDSVEEIMRNRKESTQEHLDGIKELLDISSQEAKEKENRMYKKEIEDYFNGEK